MSLHVGSLLRHRAHFIYSHPCSDTVHTLFTRTPAQTPCTLYLLAPLLRHRAHFIYCRLAGPVCVCRHSSEVCQSRGY